MKSRTCANCEIVFDWKPTVRASLAYCCEGCAEGGPCSCDYALLRATLVAQPQPIRVVRFEIRTRSERRF